MNAQTKAVVLTESEEVLERRVVNRGRALTETEFSELLALADSLRQYDERRNQAPLDALAQGDAIARESYSVVLAYEVAENLGIPKAYLDRARQKLFPSAEEKLVEIKKYSAKIDFEVLHLQFERELQRALQAYFSPSKIMLKRSNNFGKRQFFAISNGTSWWKKKKDRIAIFFLDYATSPPRTCFFDLYDPRFFSACGQKLEELEHYFSERGFDLNYSFIVHYPV